MDKKICVKCGDKKDFSEFTKRKESKDGLYNTCRKCRSVAQKEYYKTDKGQEVLLKMRYSENRKKSQRKYRRSEKGKKNQKEYSKTDIYKQNQKKYRQSDKGREFFNKRHSIDENYHLVQTLRNRVGSALKSQNAEKCSQTMDLIGCSINNLKQHLESLFQEGMVWSNHGEWHIDHKIPCASFDLKDENQQRECFYYKNLQPLWAIDNLKKGSKIL